MRKLVILTILALLLPVLALPATAQVDTGTADFSRYVALGDSLTAAIVSAGWVERFQQNSYPALIHRQATGTDAGFEQPLIGAPGITPPLFLANLVPPVFASEPGLGQPLNLQLPRPYNNLGIPGARVRDTLRTVTQGGAGPHDLVLRGQGTALLQGLALQPTFVSLWIGNNDALAAATSGTVIDGVTLTTAAAFEADYRAIAGALAGSGADLLFVNIPEVTVIPFVTTIPPIVVNPATNQPVLGPNGQFIPLIGPDGPLSLADHVLLTASGLLAQGFGIPTFLGGNGQPLPGTVVLNAAETAAINGRVGQYNNIIRQVAGEVGAAYYDFNGSFRKIAAEGLSVGGIAYGTGFLTGGLFSYDGVHASPFGYAFVANEMIAVINDRFDAKIPPVGLGPFVFGEFQLDPRGQLLRAGSAASRALITEDGLNNMRFLGMQIPAVSGVQAPPGVEEPGEVDPKVPANPPAVDDGPKDRPIEPPSRPDRPRGPRRGDD
jgi:lysophospholipase L1-like esterase